MLRTCLFTCCFFFLSGVLSTADGADALQAYNVNPSTVAVYGSSSGGFMAAQMGIAYSSLFAAGVAVDAGGPYDCVRSNPQQWWLKCIGNGTPDISTSVVNMRAWSGNEIDDVANIANQKIYLYTGLDDIDVGPNVMNQLHSQLLNFVPGSNFKYDQIAGATHGFNNGFDITGSALRWTYGNLRLPSSAFTGQLLAFDQTAYVAPGNGMDTTGFLYVPTNCANRQPCKLLVALHGCGWNYQSRGENGFAGVSSYLKQIADANDIIVLYPQTANDSANRTDSAGVRHNNPAGCWDYYGLYSNSHYDHRIGPQVSAIAGMVSTITGAPQPFPASDCLFRWAETNFRTLFSPPGATSQRSSPYYYRHYSATNVYLGTSSADNHLYFLDASGSLYDMGALASWLPVADCR